MDLVQRRASRIDGRRIGTEAKPGLIVVVAFGLVSAPACAVPSAPVPSSVPVAASSASDYRLGPGDKLKVAVFGVDALGGEFEVPGGGRVALPLIGETQAAGLTTFQLQQRIEAALREGYLKDPHVTVQVENYRPFFILGEVNKPGEYPFTDRLTVLNAVAEAGGFTYRARTRIFRRRHGDHDGEATEKLTADSLVQPGDTIRIQERSF